MPTTRTSSLLLLLILPLLLLLLLLPLTAARISWPLPSIFHRHHAFPFPRHPRPHPPPPHNIHASPAIANVSTRPRLHRVAAREFLTAHNKARVAAGELPLTWDRNLTSYALSWANKRVSDCQIVHSQGPFGENIFTARRAHWTPSQIVGSWVGEEKDYNPQTNECAAGGKRCGHYTQVVWKDSRRVGCARVACHNGGLFAVCSYDPPGNIANELPFSGSGSD